MLIHHVLIIGLVLPKPIRTMLCNVWHISKCENRLYAIFMILLIFIFIFKHLMIITKVYGIQESQKTNGIMKTTQSQFNESYVLLTLLYKLDLDYILNWAKLNYYKSIDELIDIDVPALCGDLYIYFKTRYIGIYTIGVYLNDLQCVV